MYAYATRVNQREKVISGAVAAGLHLMFLALLVFGVNWQKKIEPPVNIVDLWTSPLPAAPALQPAPEPPPPPPPVVKPVPELVAPAPVKTPKPEVAKPDIALKDKLDKEKRAAEEKQAEAKKKEDDAKKAAKKKEDEAQKAEAAQKAQAADAQRAAEEQAEAQRRVASQAATAQAKLIADYKERIRSKIMRLILLPQNLQGNPEAEFDVVLLPDGNPLAVKLKRSSGNAAYDSAVERAILKAQPLPLPPDPALFRYFRELNLTFRPQQ